MDTSLRVGSFISFGWETFKKRPWFLIGAVVILFIAQMCLNFIMGIIDGIGEAAQVQAGAGFISFVINMTGTVVISMGTLAFFLKAHDSLESVQIADAWHPQKFWSFLGLLILLYIIFIIGFLLLIVPGVIALLMFMFAPYLVVDRGLGPIEALKESARITSGHKWRLLALLGAVSLVALAGFLALFVGLLVAIPVVYLANMHAYRTLSAPEGATPQPLTGGEKVLAALWLLIPIVAVTAAILVASFAVAVGKGGEAKNYADLMSLGVGVETYYDMNDNAYPATLTEGAALSPVKDIDLNNFRYQTNTERSSYTLCTEGAVPEGTEPCLSSEGNTTAGE